MKTYHFPITLAGSGDSIEEAWEEAVSAFSLDSGVYEEYELVDEE